MSTMTLVDAVYENGLLRLLQPLNLPDQTKVRVAIREPIADPVLALVGAFRSDRPLIDNIPVTADPDLYLVADALGDEAIGRHAWEIAPARYRRGENDEPSRIE